MSGLDIVLEERERSPVLRAPEAHHLSEPAMAHENHPSAQSFAPDEMLLPPLPDSDDSDLLSAPHGGLGPSLNSGFGPSFSTGAAPENMASGASSTTLSAPHGGQIHGSTTPYSEISKNSKNDSFFFVPESYALDSSALNIDTPPIAFPSIDGSEKAGQKSTFASTTSLTHIPSLTPISQTPSAGNTSPLRRLKSLKNGIRKLSLSRMGSFTSSASAGEKAADKLARDEGVVRPQFPQVSQFSQNSQNSQNSHNSQNLQFPLFSPTTSEFSQGHAHADASSSSSGAESVKSTFSHFGFGLGAGGAAAGSGTINVGHVTGPHHSFSTTASSPQGPTHAHTSSAGSSQSGNGTRTRRRTVSGSNPQPIITLSENLASTKKNLAAIEQSFFENWSGPISSSGNISSRSSSVSQPLELDPSTATATATATATGAATTAANNQNSQNGQGSQNPQISTDIAALNTPDDLVEYSVYLSEHRKAVEVAYEVSRDRLVRSGWCSGHDIENLNLQRDSSVSQIDSKLLQIEAKLNAEFNVSFLQASGATQRTEPRRKCAPHEALSPSLKDLENQCSYFSAEHGNICQY